MNIISIQSIKAAVVQFLTQPLAQSAERHFLTGFGATLVVGLIPVVQDIESGKSINLSTEQTVIVAAFVGAVAAGFRAALPALRKLVGKAL